MPNRFLEFQKRMFDIQRAKEQVQPGYRDPYIAADPPKEDVPEHKDYPVHTEAPGSFFTGEPPDVNRIMDQEFNAPTATTQKQQSDYENVMRRQDVNYMLDEAFEEEPSTLHKTGRLAEEIGIAAGQGVADLARSAKVSAEARDIEALPTEELLKTTLEKKEVGTWWREFKEDKGVDPTSAEIDTKKREVATRRKQAQIKNNQKLIEAFPESKGRAFEGGVMMIVEDAATGLVRSWPIMVSASVNPLIGFSIAAIQMHGQKADELLEQGYTPEEANQAAKLYAAPAALLETAGAVFGIRAFKTVFGKAGAGLGLSAVAKKKVGAVLQNMIAEGTEEFLQEEWDVIVTVYAENPNASPESILSQAKEIWASPEQMRKASYAAVVGGVGGIMPGAAGAAMKQAVALPKKALSYKRPLKAITDEDYNLIQKGEMTQVQLQKKYKGRADIQGLIDKLYAEYTPPVQETAAIPEQGPTEDEVAAFYGLDAQELFDDVFLEEGPAPPAVEDNFAGRARELLVKMGKKEPTEAEVAEVVEKIERFKQPELSGVDAEIMESADIKIAALRYKGEVFTGANHGEAMDRVEDKFGYIPDEDFISGKMEDGFLTTDDEFLNRTEAYKVADEAGQIKREPVIDPTYKGPDLSVMDEPLIAEDLMEQVEAPPKTIKDLDQKPITPPTVFYRGETKEKTGKRITTGDEFWDSQLFISSDEAGAKMYGEKITRFEARPDAKILYEGTKPFVAFHKGIPKTTSLLESSSIVAKKAKEAGYDAVWFKRQGDVGTIVFNKEAFTKGAQAAPKKEFISAKAAKREKVYDKKPVTKESVAAARKKSAEIAKRLGIPEVKEQIEPKKGQKQQVSPGKWEVPTSPGMRSIYAPISALIDQAHLRKTGEAKVLSGLRDYTPDTVLVNGLTLQNLIDKFNAGERWLKVKEDLSTAQVGEKEAAAIKKVYDTLPVIAEPTKLGDKLIAGFHAIAKKSKRLHFFKKIGKFSGISGFHIGADSFLSDTADVGWHTYMHETFHDLRTENAELFKSMIKLVKPLVDIAKFKEYKKAVNDSRIARGREAISNELMMEEYMAIHMGTAANTKAFWKKVFSHDYALFDALGQKVMEILKTAGPHVNDASNSRMFSDSDTVMDALADGYKEYWSDAGLFVKPGEKVDKVSAAQAGYAAESLSYSLDPTTIAAILEGQTLKDDTIKILDLLGRAGSVDDSLMTQLAIQKFTPKEVLTEKEIKLRNAKVKGPAKAVYEKALKAYDVTKKLSRKQVANQLSRDERPSFMNITLAMKNNKGLKTAVKKLGKDAGVELFEQDGSFKHHPMEERTKPDTDKVFKLLPLYGGFRRSIAQTMVDEMPQARKEAFRKDIIKWVEKAYKDGTDPKLFDRKLEAIQDNEYRIASAVRVAHKTLGAINLNSMCPMFNIGNHGCYLDGCYVTGQGMGGQGLNFYNTALYTGELLQMSQEAIDKFNAVGGLRINGSGDTTTEQFGALEDVLKHAGMRGLKLKWITKQEAAFEFIHKMQSSKDKNVKKTAMATVLQPTVDPYWVPVTEDDMKGSAVDVLELAKAAKAGKTDAVIAAYKQVTGREARVINGQVFRKYGFSSAQLAEMSKKYKKVKVQPRLVVGTFKEIAKYALETPQMIQTWMHAAIRPGLYSEIDGKVLGEGEIGNFRLRATFVLGLTGYELKGTNAKGKVVEGAKVYEAFNKYVAKKYTPQQRVKIFNALFGMLKKDSSALCCRAGATTNACDTCTSHCMQGTSYTGTELRGIAEKATQLATFPEEKPVKKAKPVKRVKPEVMESIEITPALEEWNKDAESQGTFFHATDAVEDFDTFDPDLSDLGMHFGTVEQAGDMGERDTLHGRMRTFPVRLNIKKPLRIIDTGAFSRVGIEWQLAEHKDLDDAKSQEVIYEMIDELDLIETDMDSQEYILETNKIMRAYIQDLGYDGLVYLNRGEGFGGREVISRSKDTDKAFFKENPDAKDSWVAFESNQVKSVWNKKPTEAPSIMEETDIEKILREKIGVEKKSIKSKVVDAFDDFWANKTTRTVDKLHPIKEKLGGDGTAYMLHRGIPGVQSTLNALMWHGKLGMDVDGVITTNTTDQGFLKWMKDVGQDGEKAFYWIMAKRAETLEKEGRENWLTPDVRKIILDWVGDPKGKRSWEQINKEFQEWNKNILDLAVRAGLLTDSQIEEWQRDFYIPFYRVFENQEANAEYIKGPQKGKINLSARVMRLKGAEEKLGDPFENIIRNWSHLVGESMSNVARAEAYNFAKSHEVPSGLTIINDDGLEESVPMIEDAKWSDTVLFKTQKGTKATFIEKKTGAEVLSFKDKGKTKFFKVNDPELFQALSMVNKDYLDGVLMRIMSGTKRMLTAGATFGPAFRVANMIRDTLHTFQITDKMSFVPFIDTAKGFVSAWRQDQDFVDFMASGHAFGGSYVRADDPKAMDKHIKKLAKQHNKSFGSIAKTMLDTPSKLLEFWEKVGGASENAARVQLYKNLKKEGKTTLESAFAARDLMDFQMSGNGDVVGFLIATVPFLNARMQGLYRMGRAAVENPKVFFAKGAMITAATMLLWWLNHDDDRYKSLESWEKFSYYHFWIGDTHFRIPKPFETGAIFSTMFEASADVAVGTDDGKHLIEAVVHTLGETFAFNPIPQAVKPIAEQWANKSFFTGRPIESQYQQKMKRGARYDPWTSPTLILAGKMGIPPKRAEVLIRGFTADIGMSLLWISDIFARNFADFPVKPAMRIDEMPMIGRFVRQAGPKRSTKYMSKFWDMMKEVDQLVTTVNMYKKSGDFEGAVRIAEKNQELIKFRPYMNKARQQLRKMSHQVKRIWNDPNMLADAKKEMIDKIYEERNILVKKIYDSYLKDL